MTLSAAPAPSEALESILSAEATSFLTDLHERFDAARLALLAERTRRSAPSDFLPETAGIRHDRSWRVVAPPADYLDRRVEITGPTDRKLVINALNSGARGFMADFEDANSPTWRNQVDGQFNLRDAVRRTITYESADSRRYELVDQPATLLVRPRGLHLDEAHVTDGEQPLAGSLFDFGLFAFHNAAYIAGQGRHVHLYLPKLEHHLEARWWNEVLTHSESALGVPGGTFRATVLIETLPAAFQMDEILYELRERSSGLNAGRWDYIFSTLKCLGDRPEFILPDRADVKMTVPFMRSYTELLVRTTHARGAFAMGGMAALIPSRDRPEANQRAIDAVREDKAREASAGFDGTWVAHPDVVSVAAAEFDKVLGERPNQLERQREDVEVTGAQLLDVAATPGEVTEAGLRSNLNVGFQYISYWLGGRGAVGLNDLMEDAATAEISRAQIWQWMHHGVKLPDGRTVTRELVNQLLEEELAGIRAAVGEQTWLAGLPDQTRVVFEDATLRDELPPFLTLVGYPVLLALESQRA